MRVRITAATAASPCGGRGIWLSSAGGWTSYAGESSEFDTRIRSTGVSARMLPSLAPRSGDRCAWRAVPRRSEQPKGPMMTTRAILPAEDLQQSPPSAPISLTKAGVTRSAKAIRISHDGVEQLFQAEISCFADLNPRQKGVHMSRFEEGINEAIDEVVLSEALVVEALAQHIAERVVSAQGALRSEVTIRATYPKVRLTPVSGIPSQEMYELIGVACATPGTARRLVGVSAQGMNACPCAQGLIRAQAEVALARDGFTLSLIHI